MKNRFLKHAVTMLCGVLACTFVFVASVRADDDAVLSPGAVAPDPALTPEQMLPAAAQGVVGIECLASNVELRALLAGLNDQTAARTTLAERTIARILQANCQSPVAAHATTIGSVMTITALVAMPDGSRVVRGSIGGQSDDAEQLATRLATQLIADGAQEILAAIGGAHA